MPDSLPSRTVSWLMLQTLLGLPRSARSSCARAGIECIAYMVSRACQWFAYRSDKIGTPLACKTCHLSGKYLWHRYACLQSDEQGGFKHQWFAQGDTPSIVYARFASIRYLYATGRVLSKHHATGSTPKRQRWWQFRSHRAHGGQQTALKYSLLYSLLGH